MYKMKYIVFATKKAYMLLRTLEYQSVNHFGTELNIEKLMSGGVYASSVRDPGGRGYGLQSRENSGFRCCLYSVQAGCVGSGEILNLSEPQFLFKKFYTVKCSVCSTYSFLGFDKCLELYICYHSYDMNCFITPKIPSYCPFCPFIINISPISPHLCPTQLLANTGLFFFPGFSECHINGITCLYGFF